MKPFRKWLHRSSSFQKYGVTDHAADPTPTLSPDNKAYINRLSVELLADIFVRCLPFAGCQYPAPKASDAPLLLCQVCGYWREAACATPALWASFYVNPATIHRSLVALWLKRSEPSPLSFHLSASSSPFGRKSAKAIFAMFLSNLNRWYSAHLKLDKSLCKMILMLPPETSSPVRHLGLDARGCTKEQRSRLLSITRLFPQLRRLMFSAPFALFSNAVPISTVDLPCSQLTHIRLTGGLSMYQCSQILFNCKQAVSCQFSGIYGTSEPIPQRSSLLPCLRSLKLDSVANTCDLGVLLRFLICPAIRSLSLNQGKWRQPASDAQALHSFLTHSERGLHEFRLSDSNVAESDVLDCLQTPSLQSIHTLYISIPSITDRMLSFLQRGGDLNYDAFPHLQKLSLKYCYSSDGSLSKMVASRRFSRSEGRQTMLQSIHVTFRLPVSLNQLTAHNNKEGDEDIRRAHRRDLARLQALQEQGLQASWATEVW